MSDKKKDIEPFNLIDLDVTELERRLELAPNECTVSASFTGGCKTSCKDFKSEAKLA
jgi:hypothetical protein